MGRCARRWWRTHHRQVYAEVPPQVEYSLTEKGTTLAPIIMSLKHRGDTHVGEARLA